MDEKELNNFLKEQTQYMSNLEEVLSALSRNLYYFLSELNDTTLRENEEFQKVVKGFEIQTEFIQKYIETVHHEIPELTKVIKDSQDHIEYLKTKLEEMERIFENNNRNQQTSSEKLEDVTHQLQIQSSFSSAMGSILGTMLWKTCKSAEIVEVFIETGTLREFLIMANCTLNSFMDTYKDLLPPLDCYEFKFILSIFGTVINISAQKPGRDYILNEIVGKMFTESVLKNLNHIEMPVGKILKRMFIMYLYNVSIGSKGANTIQSNHEGIRNIVKCLEPTNTVEIHSLTITFLLCLLKEAPTAEYCQLIINLTSREILNELLKSEDENLQHLTNKYIQKLSEIQSGTNN